MELDNLQSLSQRKAERNRLPEYQVLNLRYRYSMNEVVLWNFKDIADPLIH